MDHVADFSLEGVQISLRITVVRTPAGAVVNVVVALCAGLCVISVIIPVLERYAVKKVNDDCTVRRSLNGLLPVRDACAR